MIPNGIRRIDFGGKAMTNHFKELVSYRSLHLLDETYLVESIKDLLCFVSLDVEADLLSAAAKGWESPHRREFVLPDGVNNLRGYLRDRPATDGKQSHSGKSGPGPQFKEQVLVVNNESFMVPEILFNPTDIGLDQSGIAETIVQAVKAVPACLHALLYSNIMLIGGVTRCPGFKDRLMAELRPMVCDTYEIHIDLPETPHTYAWGGGSIIGCSREYNLHATTRAQYLKSRNFR